MSDELRDNHHEYGRTLPDSLELLSRSKPRKSAGQGTIIIASDDEAVGSKTGKVLVCVGTEDPLISVGERLMFEEQMRAAGVDWRMNLYGGAQHSFTHPQADRVEVPRLQFDQISAERS